ncbi:hypothetical protein FA15DRAFT_672316 [Coprinopsis marcescibilis]|uniref:F-box domain-containing protein n=1 Tax=Coprinopsis marcescibilis TaxID=230819 RepID=A0A5C3KML1_COPMA|nr:hypothetical protein FA15DRAFT_672316 [Coprinopsis marcescibilis]
MNSTTSTFVPIPQELIELIIGYVSHPPTLRACALTGPQFLHASQRGLFAEVVLSPPKSKHSSNTTPAQRFLNTIISSPHLTSFVRALVIECEDSVLEQPWLYSDTALQHILPILSKLAKISVNGKIHPEHERAPTKANLSWSSLSATLRSALTSIMRTGTVIDLELGGFSRIPVSYVIQSCSQLKKLSLLPLYVVDDVDKDDTVSEDELAAEPPMINDNNSDDSIMCESTAQLEDITIKQSGIALRRTTDWLLRPGSGPNINRLQKINFTVSDNEDHLCVAKIVDACAGTLKHLELTPGPEVGSVRHLLRKVAPPEDLSSSAFGLSNLGELHSLKINTEIRMYKLNNNRYSDPLPWIVSLLSSLPDKNLLSTLELSIGMHVNQQTLESVVWTKLVKLLSQEQFTGLQRFVLNLSLVPAKEGGESQAVPRWVPEVLKKNVHLATLLNKGLLTLDC